MVWSANPQSYIETLEVNPLASKRGAAKARKEARKQARRKRLARDRWVTERYGDAGHRQCGKKSRYPDEDSALVCASRYYALGAPRLRAYKCKFCGGWHLTSKELWTEETDKKEEGRMAEKKDWQVHEKTRRMAAIDARLGMTVEDISSSLGITEDAVRRAIAEFEDASNEDLGMREADDDSDDGDAPATALVGTFWAIVGALGEPVALFSSEDRALAVCGMLNRMVATVAGAGARAHVTAVEAYDTLWGGEVTCDAGR